MKKLDYLFFLAKKVFKLFTHSLSAPFKVLELLTYIPGNIVKRNRRSVIHAAQLIHTPRGGDYGPGNDVSHNTYTHCEQERYHDQADDNGVNIKIYGYATAYTTQYFIKRVSEQAAMGILVLLLAGPGSTVST